MPDTGDDYREAMHAEKRLSEYQYFDGPRNGPAPLVRGRPSVYELASPQPVMTDASEGTRSSASVEPTGAVPSLRQSSIEFKQQSGGHVSQQDVMGARDVIVSAGSRDMDTDTAVRLAAGELVSKLKGQEPSLILVAYTCTHNGEDVVRDRCVCVWLYARVCVDWRGKGRGRGRGDVKEREREREREGEREREKEKESHARHGGTWLFICVCCTSSPTAMRYTCCSYARCTVTIIRSVLHMRYMFVYLARAIHL